VLVRYISSTITALTNYLIIVRRGRTPPQLVRISVYDIFSHSPYLVGRLEGGSERGKGGLKSLLENTVWYLG